MANRNDDLNRSRPEQWLAFVVAPVVWSTAVVLGVRGTTSAVIATAVYLATYYGVRAWRQRRHE